MKRQNDSKKSGGLIQFLKLIHLPTILAIALFYILLCLVCYLFLRRAGEEIPFADVFLFNMLATLGNDYQFTDIRWLRLMGIIFLAFGMLSLSVVSGFISSALVDKRLNIRKGIRKMQKIKQHIIICGYKADIRNLISDILRKNKSKKAGDIVWINNVDEMKVQSILDDDELRDINYIRGDFTEEQTLLNANAKFASRVLILGENEEGLEDELTDSRVFAATLMIRNLNPKCHICSEVKTERYRNYLESQNCCEIIYSEAYTRYILATSTSYSGMSKVMSALLDNGDGVSIQIKPIEEYWYGKQFRELAEHYKKQSNYIVLGVMENMGAEKELKHQILSEAQKSTNYGEIVTRLKRVKTMETNYPHLNPKDDYVLGQNMGAIILGDEV